MDYKKLEELNRLRQSGALTDEEFEQEKQKILNGESRKDTFGISDSSYLGLINLLLLIRHGDGLFLSSHGSSAEINRKPSPYKEDTSSTG